ncbi:MAG: PDZ domain-containing protein [Ignavibacteriaceae bacterium]|nr:PDZ domain-containing protein [Ignavibacteriaceae bacterium]
MFSYAGDLYTVDATGGTARKLTNDVGFEMFARFSPDGKNIAFTGQYDGNTEVFLIPAGGGVPKRLTYTATLNRDDVSDRMGPNNIVMGWSGDEILFRSRWTEPNDFKGQLYRVNKNGGPAVQLPLPRGGFASFSPDGKQLAYNRVFREFRTWKHYRGGQADDVWIYDFNSKQTSNITDNPAQDIIPMWHGNKIYFISDRDYRMNLFSYDLTTKETKKLTNFTEYDIKFPSLGDNAMVFENGGYIYKFDLSAEKAEKVSVYINEDFDGARGGLTTVSKNITNFEIAPDGSRALFGARGEIFTVPAKNGNTRNLTNTSGVHERSSKWSPDGKWISYISDITGETEIFIMPQDGKGEAIQLTKEKGSYKYQALWSPDSKKLLWSSRDQKLFVTDVESKKTKQIAESNVFELNDYSWSPDNKWVAYSRPEKDTEVKIYLYSLENEETIEATDGWYSSYSPLFSADGKYLFFVSDRSFSPIYSQTEWNHAYRDMSKIYFLTLAKDTKSPFEPKSDEVKVLSDDKKEDKKDEKKDEKKEETKSVKIDKDGLQTRIAALPGSAGNYFNLSSVGNKLYYMFSSSSSRKPMLMMYDLEGQKENELGSINGYEISADGKKMLAAQNGSYGIIDLPSSKLEIKDKLDISEMTMKLDRHAEWQQIFTEAWRQMRDFFFDPNMHGVNWAAMKEKYQPLVKYVNHRADLTYVIGEMVGELNIGHAYVGGGDYPKPERINLGLLGAKLEKDNSIGFYKIAKILKGENWDKSERSPLTEIGVNANEGDFIIAVNGEAVNKMNDIYEALINTAGKQVTLTVNSKPSPDGAHETVVIPIDNEQPLYYNTWVQENIDKVTKATNGQVGYIHIPDMSVNGLNQFVKYYYPQLTKKALIIDDRGNGGGNVSPMITERLQRTAAMFVIARNTIASYDPGGTHVGPKVLLLDEYSASDGDIFPYRFRHHNLGKLIGKRSWGGVVGIRGSLPFVDGGTLTKPEFSRYDLEGKEWIMEGYGVDPDIYVDNDPAKEYSGEDQQLNKAIEVVLKELKEQTGKTPDVPKYPDKSK